MLATKKQLMWVASALGILIIIGLLLNTYLLTPSEPSSPSAQGPTTSPGVGFKGPQGQPPSLEFDQ